MGRICGTLKCNHNDTNLTYVEDFVKVLRATEMGWHPKFSGQILLSNSTVHLTYAYSKFVLQIFIVCKFDKFRISN